MGTDRAAAKGLQSLTACNIPWSPGPAGRPASLPVIASEAKQSIARHKGWMDCFVASLLAMTGKERGYPPAFNRSAAFGAKYVNIPSAPARLKPSRLSIIARSPSIQPLFAAPAIIAYSPDTW